MKLAGTEGEPPVPALLMAWGKFESKILVNIGVAMFLIATTIMLVEAFSRTFLNHSFFWAEEAVRYLFVWAFFLNIGVAGSKGYHIRTGMLVDTFNKPWKVAINSLVCLTGIGFGGILFYAALPHWRRFYTLGMMTESNLDIPLWVLFSVLPIGSVFLIVYYMASLWIALRGGDPFDVDNSHDTNVGEPRA